LRLLIDERSASPNRTRFTEIDMGASKNTGENKLKQIRNIKDKL